MMKRFLTYGAFAVMASGLAACTQPEIPQDNYYRLEVPAPAKQAQKLDGVLEVERFRADGLTSGRPIVYVKDRGQLSEYHYHFWVEPPVDLLQDAMVDYLRAANIASHVVTPDLRMNEDYLLTGQIQRLERDVTSVEKVVVELDLGLKRLKDDQIIVLKSYKRELVQEQPGVNGAVGAINTALQQIYDEFLSDINVPDGQ